MARGICLEAGLGLTHCEAARVKMSRKTGELKWKFEMTDVTDSVILTTASDLLFTGGREGYFQALDARTGKRRDHLRLVFVCLRAA